MLASVKLCHQNPFFPLAVSFSRCSKFNFSTHIQHCHLFYFQMVSLLIVGNEHTMFTHAHLTTISTLSDSPFTDETHLRWNSPGALMMCAAAQAKQTWNVFT